MDSWSKHNTITVGVRVRPLMGHDQRQQDVVRVIGGNTIVCLDPDKVSGAPTLHLKIARATRVSKCD